MQNTKGAVNLSEFADLSKVRVVPEGPVMLLYSPNPETTEKVYAQLKGKSPKFDVYRRNETPESWHYRDNQRIGDLVVIVHGGAVGVVGQQNRGPSKGTHGYDEQEFRTMDAIFYAAGPNVQPGVTLKRFENVNVFPFITKILSLRIRMGSTGSFQVLEGAYRN